MFSKIGFLPGNTDPQKIPGADGIGDGDAQNLPDAVRRQNFLTAFIPNGSNWKRNADAGRGDNLKRIMEGEFVALFDRCDAVLNGQHNAAETVRLQIRAAICVIGRKLAASTSHMGASLAAIF